MPDHHPPHVYLDHTWYMVSAKTHGNSRLLATVDAKAILRDSLRDLTRTHQLTLRAWVILDDHHHVLLKTAQGSSLPRFLAQLHGRASRRLNILDSASGRQVWHNYWDSCIRSEIDLWTRFNYIHQNPVKQRYVRNVEDWAFSSYHYYLRTKGVEWLADCLSRYPVVDFSETDEPEGSAG